MYLSHPVFLRPVGPQKWTLHGVHLGGSAMTHDGSHQYTPNVSINGPAPWILWVMMMMVIYRYVYIYIRTCMYILYMYMCVHVYILQYVYIA